MTYPYTFECVTPYCGWCEAPATPGPCAGFERWRARNPDAVKRAEEYEARRKFKQELREWLRKQRVSNWRTAEVGVGCKRVPRDRENERAP